MTLESLVVVNNLSIKEQCTIFSKPVILYSNTWQRACREEVSQSNKRGVRSSYLSPHIYYTTLTSPDTCSHSTCTCIHSFLCPLVYTSCVTFKYRACTNIYLRYYYTFFLNFKNCWDWRIKAVSINWWFQLRFLIRYKFS